MKHFLQFSEIVIHTQSLVAVYKSFCISIEQQEDEVGFLFLLRNCNMIIFARHKLTAQTIVNLFQFITVTWDNNKIFIKYLERFLRTFAQPGIILFSFQTMLNFHLLPFNYIILSHTDFYKLLLKLAKKL